MAHHRLRNDVIESFTQSWSKARPENASVAVAFLTEIYDRFREENLADPHFERELTSGSAQRYCQRTAELLLADMLWKDGFHLTSKPVGPDFFVTKNGKSAWVELHTPEPIGIPAEHFARGQFGVASSTPFNEINLRWTNAISTKTKKLKTYQTSGIVGPDDAYVIAVNAHLLSSRPWDGLSGVSQKPIPVEILLSVGPLQLDIDRATGDIVDQYHQHRPRLEKTGTAKEVEADSFLDERNSSISAVLGLDLLEQIALGEEHHSALVYNPLATNPISKGWISAQAHWGCVIEPTSYLVTEL
ncbi:hypothetical protein ACQKP6_19425 [Pseudomonas fluorescens]|uniref:hypothetical protein n=1 Tax=Pseudomonas fluorescens TaxID=294 RepID=UPI003D0864C6